MPKKSEKPVHEMTTDELAQKVFHPKVLKHLKKTVQEHNTEPKRRPSQKQSNTE